MNWSDLLAALALYLVLEGLLPFLSPRSTKRVMSMLAGTADAQLRLWGLASISAGIVLLYFVRARI